MPDVRFVCARTVCAVLALSGAVAARAAADDTGVIYACVNSNGANRGQVRIVSESEACAKNETRMSWNIGGPAGPQGLQGPQGPAGPQGPQGVAGSGASGGGGPIDTDGDGIPDALDPCPSYPNLSYGGGSYCPATIYQLMRGELATGATVWIGNVLVTDVTAPNLTVAVAPGDPGYDGDDYSRVTMNAGSIPLPPVGARVNVIGAVTAGGGFTPAAIVVLTHP